MVIQKSLLEGHVGVEQRALRAGQARLRVEHFEGRDGAEVILLLLGFDVLLGQIARCDRGIDGGVGEVDGVQSLADVERDLLADLALGVAVAHFVDERVGELRLRGARSQRERDLEAGAV